MSSPLSPLPPRPLYPVVLSRPDATGLGAFQLAFELPQAITALENPGQNADLQVFYCEWLNKNLNLATVLVKAEAKAEAKLVDWAESLAQHALGDVFTELVAPKGLLASLDSLMQRFADAARIAVGEVRLDINAVMVKEVSAVAGEIRTVIKKLDDRIKALQSPLDTAKKSVVDICKALEVLHLVAEGAHTLPSMQSGMQDVAKYSGLALTDLGKLREWWERLSVLRLQLMASLEDVLSDLDSVEKSKSVSKSLLSKLQKFSRAAKPLLQRGAPPGEFTAEEGAVANFPANVTLAVNAARLLYDALYPGGCSQGSSTTSKLEAEVAKIAGDRAAKVAASLKAAAVVDKFESKLLGEVGAVVLQAAQGLLQLTSSAPLIGPAARLIEGIISQAMVRTLSFYLLYLIPF